MGEKRLPARGKLYGEAEVLGEESTRMGSSSWRGELGENSGKERRGGGDEEEQRRSDELTLSHPFFLLHRMDSLSIEYSV